MKVIIDIGFGYGAWKIQFRKEHELPFVPFYDMVLLDSVDDYENDIRFVNNEFTTTTILYDTNDNAFKVDIRNVWKRPVSDSYVDELLLLFSNTKWDRIDTTDIDKFKKLMNKNNKLGIY